MRKPPIRIRTFLLGTVLVLCVVPSLVGAAAWVIARKHQQASVHERLSAAVDYVTAHHAAMEDPASIRGFAKLLDRRGLLGQLVIVTTRPPGKRQLYASPAITRAQPARALVKKGGPTGKSVATAPAAPSASLADDHRLLPGGTRKSPATLALDLFYRPTSRANRALVALLSGIVVLLAGLAIAVWLAGRWMVAPLAGLSAQVDKVAGGDLTIAVPRSRIGEITNIAQAVEGMTTALGETAQRRAEADEARRFLVTSIAHDLRTPLFALRGHLQAIGSRLGNPAVHLARAEARAEALERLIGNLFAYTRDDYTQPTLQLEPVTVAGLLREVAAALEHATRLRGTTLELEGDEAIVATVDRDRFKRALTNIVDNALRFSPPRASVHLRWAATDESTIRITVEDHGPGIDPYLLPHIFEPGIRGAPAAGSRDDGAGLGLTIARRLLEHQGATLSAHNRTTGGVAMCLTLQRAPSPGPA